MLVPQVEIDSELLFSNITPAFRKDLNRFQPFGPGNPAPVFVTRGVVSHGDEARRRGVRAPAHGPHAAAEAQHDDSDE